MWTRAANLGTVSTSPSRDRLDSSVFRMTLIESSEQDPDDTILVYKLIKDVVWLFYRRYRRAARAGSRHIR